MVLATTPAKTAFPEDRLGAVRTRQFTDQAGTAPDLKEGLADLPSDMQLLVMARRLEKQAQQLSEKLDRLQCTLWEAGEGEEGPLSEPMLW